MNINEVLTAERKQRKFIGKRARTVATICVFACALMFSFQLIAAFIQSLLLEFTNIYESSTVSYLLDMLFYVFYIFCPFGIGALILKRYNKRTEIFLPKRSSPKFPPLFITGAIGAGYIINLLISLLFPSFVELFRVDVIVTADNPLDIVLCIIMSAVLPAILEEWAFRGVLLKNMLPYGRGGAIVISSVLFGMAHLDPPRIIFATAFGLVLGLCYEYTGSLLLPMTIHFLNNSISVIATLVPEDSLIVIFIGLFIFAFMGCGIAAIIVYSIKGIKKQKISLIKQAHRGYTLSVGRFVSRMFLNFASIPYFALYAFIFILSFFPSLIYG